MRNHRPELSPRRPAFSYDREPLGIDNAWEERKAGHLATLEAQEAAGAADISEVQFIARQLAGLAGLFGEHRLAAAADVVDQAIKQSRYQVSIGLPYAVILATLLRASLPRASN